MIMTKAPFAIPLRPDYTPRYGHSLSAPHTRPSDALFRALAVAVKYEYGDQKRSVLEEIKASYGEDDVTRLVMGRLITKAAVIPADTTTSGWADSLVSTVIGGLAKDLEPISVYGQLSALGDAYTLGRAGTVLIPARNTSASVSGAFVGQGLPIPVKQGQFLPISLTMKKLAVITCITREIAEHSVPAIEGILRTAMTNDTGVAIDTILLDTGAATGIRPVGLRNVTKVNASGTASIVGLIADLKALAGALMTGARGTLRVPVWIMNPIDALAAGLLQSTGGDFPFADQLSRGSLLGIPLLTSSTVTADTMLLVDAADFITVASDAPEFNVSNQATFHREDTTPLAISTPGAPATIAAPVSSMWQQDSIAIRMIWPMNWGLQRAGTVQWSDTLAWN
jgi:Phage capsid family